MKYLITRVLPCTNGIKHLGNLVGSMLPADVYARFLRQRGKEVLYICATDEHGTPAELAAAEAGVDVATYCRDLSWGVPVPRPGFEGKVFYVWFDAPIGYIRSNKRVYRCSSRGEWVGNVVA